MAFGFNPCKKCCFKGNGGTPPGGPGGIGPGGPGSGGPGGGPGGGGNDGQVCPGCPVSIATSWNVTLTGVVDGGFCTHPSGPGCPSLNITYHLSNIDCSTNPDAGCCYFYTNIFIGCVEERGDTNLFYDKHTHLWTLVFGSGSGETYTLPAALFNCTGSNTLISTNTADNTICTNWPATVTITPG